MEKNILISIWEIATFLRHYNKNEYEVSLMAIFFDCIENLKKEEYWIVALNISKFRKIINANTEKLDSFNKLHLPKLNEKLERLSNVLQEK